VRRAIAVPIAAFVIVFAGIVGLTTVRRGSQQSPGAAGVLMASASRQFANVAVAAAAPADAMDAVAASPPAPTTLAWPGEKLIRSAELRIQVRDAAAAARRAESIARAHAAFVADSRISQADRAPTDARIVIRVPADSFDGVMDDVRHLGRVRTENASTGDMTREYTDLETRLAVKEQTTEQLRGLLAKRTGKLSDVLEVERELARVVTEAEQMKAQRREFDRLVAASSITITLFEPASEGLAALRVSVLGSFRQVTDVLASSLGMLVYLVTYLVPWVTLGAVGWWCVRAIRRAY
jgi:hypothetical protein